MDDSHEGPVSSSSGREPVVEKKLAKSAISPLKLFFRERRPLYERQYPGVRKNTMLTWASREFKKLSKEDRMKYIHESERLQYQETFKSCPVSQDVKSLPEPKKRRLKKKSQRLMETEDQEEDANMKAAFNLFQKQRFEKLKSNDTTVVNIFEKMKKEWQTVDKSLYLKAVKFDVKLNSGEGDAEVLQFTRDINDLTKSERKILKQLMNRYPTSSTLSGFSLFTQVNHNKSKRQDKWTHLSSIWKCLPKKTRKEYSKFAREATQEYKRQLEAFLESLDEQERRLYHRFLKTSVQRRRLIKKFKMTIKAPYQVVESIGNESYIYQENEDSGRKAIQSANPRGNQLEVDAEEDVQSSQESSQESEYSIIVKPVSSISSDSGVHEGSFLSSESSIRPGFVSQSTFTMIEEEDTDGSF